MKNRVNIFKGIMVAVMLSLLPLPTAAETAQEMAEESQAFIQELADNTLDVLDDVFLNQHERDQEFHRLLSEGFETAYLAKLVLGHHRRRATAAQMERFNEVFPEYIIEMYADRLAKYGNERFTVLGSKPVGKKDIYITVEVTRAGKQPFLADWRVRVINEELRIIDIKIEGISMLQTQRDEFSSRINQVGMDQVIDDMLERIGGDEQIIAEASE